MSVFSFPSQVNERAARLVATGVALLSTISILTEIRWLPPLLAFGFLLRVGWGPRFSPLGKFAVWAAPRLADVRLVAGPPKRFAQAIGAAVALTASLFIAFGHETGSRWLLGLLVIFAALEATVSFCLGCWSYGQLQRAGLFSADACENCHSGVAEIEPGRS